jgi:nitrogenase-associated protein
MTAIIFYAKPGCATNARQRKLLESAGHQVLVRDLLTEPWTAQRLREFFSGLPVPEWFNPAAPRIKSRNLDPHGLSEERALALMLADPLLIRRPLIEIGTTRIAGFDPQQLQAHVELPSPGQALDLQACTHGPPSAMPSSNVGDRESHHD